MLSSLGKTSKARGRQKINFKRYNTLVLKKVFQFHSIFLKQFFLLRRVTVYIWWVGGHSEAACGHNFSQFVQSKLNRLLFDKKNVTMSAVFQKRFCLGFTKQCKPLLRNPKIFIHLQKLTTNNLELKPKKASEPLEKYASSSVCMQN